MSEYVYAVRVSTSDVTDPSYIKTTYHLNNKTTEHINSLIRQNFQDSRYDSHMDEVMLFNVSYYNSNVTTRYNMLIVRTLAEIQDELFTPISSTGLFLGNAVDFDDVYDSYPSYRFSKFAECDYVQFHGGEIAMNVKQDNSHQLNISEVVF